MTDTLFVLALALGSLQSPPQKPAATAMPYDQYCQMERTEKRAAFKSMPPAHRAQLARTHLEGWRDANQARLNGQQLSLLKDMIGAITPAMFDGGTEAEQAAARERIESLETRADALFSNAERRALRYDAPCAK